MFAQAFGATRSRRSFEKSALQMLALAALLAVGCATGAQTASNVALPGKSASASQVKVKVDRPACPPPQRRDEKTGVCVPEAAEPPVPAADVRMRVPASPCDQPFATCIPGPALRRGALDPLDLQSQRTLNKGRIGSLKAAPAPLQNVLPPLVTERELLTR